MGGRRSGAAQPDSRRIRFGSMGWRGVLGEEVTHPRLRALLRGVSRWLREERGASRVLIGYDGRFASEAMARISESVLAADGLQPLLSSRPVPTPALVHALCRRRAAAALMLTASHNPAEYHGVKVFGSDGRGVPPQVARRIEAYAARADRGPPRSAPSGRRRVDFVTAYIRALGVALDGEALARARPRIFYDAIHGMGSGVLDRVLRDAGARVELFRGAVDPRFGGATPDPSPAALVEIAAALRRGRGLRVGLATDGDADRIAAVDADGRVLSETQVVALLVDHLARTGRAGGGVAISAATGSLVEKVAASYGLRCLRRQMGFGGLSQVLGEGAAGMAGDESGGFALAAFGPDKDGMLAGGLLAEIVARTRAPLGVRLRKLEARFGRSACGRDAIPATPRTLAQLACLRGAPPARVAGARVRRVDAKTGLRLALDDGFVMLRASGTEPLIRVYAEASGPRALRERLRWGAARLVERGGG